MRDPPNIFAEFVQEASTMERNFKARTRQYNLLLQVLCTNPQAKPANTENVRKIIRDIVPKKLDLIISSPSQPSEYHSLMSRNEVQLLWTFLGRRLRAKLAKL
ncbi:hypothetical protein HPB50_028213 [Hyalomma asiaticum]|nr:hypothetical protein HPB50_028213 [Hyalomma asiaticum]